MTESQFEKLCIARNLDPAGWRRELKAPLLHEKCLLDMTDEELEDHYQRVEERAESSKEDRALIILEKAQDGRLERQAKKEFSKYAKENTVFADEVPQMLENLRYELTNTEIHYLLRKFDATENFEMLPEVRLDLKSWFWLVGECEMLKTSYEHINPEAFEICYETMIQNLKLAQEHGFDPEEWPKTDADLIASAKMGNTKPPPPAPVAPVRNKFKGVPYLHKFSVEQEDELDKEIAAFKESQQPQQEEHQEADGE